MYYVYILECNDGTLYTGITTDLSRRLEQHRKGSGGHYTRSRGAKRIVFSERKKDRSKALSREAYIKRMPRSLKERLIAGKN